MNTEDLQRVCAKVEKVQTFQLIRNIMRGSCLYENVILSHVPNIFA